MNTREQTDDQPFLLINLPPSDAQRRLVFSIIGIFTIVFVAVLPFANTPLPRLDAWVPSFTAALVVSDLITSALLYSQFSISRQWALLVLATSYLFSALMVIPYALTFPGVFAPTGLLGAGLQTAAWFYLVWHMASPLSIIVYELLKTKKGSTILSQRHAGFFIGLSMAVAVAFAGTVIWFCTAHHDLLPVVYRDARTLTPLIVVSAGVVFLLCAVALTVLWFRRSSMLDLWLMVTVCAWLFEITLQGLFLTDRFSLAWYVGRTYSLIAGSVVLLVLLSEITTLYSHLARTAMRQRSARQARQIAMDAMAASIAHEVNQPLGAIVLNTEAALVHLARTPLDDKQVRAALVDIGAASARATEVVASLRAMFKKDAHGRVRFDLNDLVRQVLAMLDLNLRAQRVSVATDLRYGLPHLVADRGQLQQVFLNLVMNAIEAMQSINDRARILKITSDLVPGSSDVVIAVADSGPGMTKKEMDRIFDPFVTTKSAGMGIGLTVCRSIVESHGGTLRASANNPGGAVFEIVLPVDGAERG